MNDQEQRFLELCRHIVEWGERIPRLIDGRSFQAFAADEATYLAVWKCVEVLGEASAGIMRLDPASHERYPGLQLKAAYAMRNQLTHGYATVDLGILWVTIRDFVPQMVDEARVIVLAGDR